MAVVEPQSVNRSVDQPVWFAHINPKKSHSEYITNYTSHQLLPLANDYSRKISPLNKTDPVNHTVGPSEHRAQYSIFEPAEQRYCRRRDQLQFSKNKFDCSTSYGQDFPFNKIGRLAPSQPPPTTISLEDGSCSSQANTLSSIYRDDYKKMSVHEMIPPIPNQPRNANRKASNDKPPVTINGNVVQSSGQNSSRSEAFEPERTLRGITDYSGNYHLWDSVRTPGVVPVYKKPKEPFVGSSCYKDTFKSPPINRTLPCRQLPSELKMEGPFFGESLYKSSYVPKPVYYPTSQVYTNNASVMYSCEPKDWWNHTATDPFLENKRQIFYQTPRDTNEVNKK